MVGADELMSDADTEEALAEFDFLVSVSHDGAGEARSHADTDWGNLTCCWVYNVLAGLSAVYTCRKILSTLCTHI